MVSSTTLKHQETDEYIVRVTDMLHSHLTMLLYIYVVLAATQAVVAHANEQTFQSLRPTHARQACGNT